MRILLLLCLLLAGTGLLTAQQPSQTELEKALEAATGKERVDILNALWKYHQFTDQDQAYGYADEALALSEELQYGKGIINSSFYLAICERDKRNLSKALRLVEKGMVAAKAGKDMRSEMVGMEVLRTIYQVQGRLRRWQDMENHYKELKNQVEFQKKTGRLKEVEAQYKNQEELLNTIQQQNEQIQSIISQNEAERLRQEAEVAKLAMEKAELAKDTFRLRNEALQLKMATTEQSLLFEKTRNLRRIFFILSGALVLLFLVGWQRYRLQQQRKMAAIEQQRVERLEEIDQLKDQFLANTSHELRTPLNGIIGIAEWLYEKRDQVDPKALASNLSILITSGKRLNNLVHDILDFSSLKNASLRVHPKAIDLKSITDLVLRINFLQAEAKGLQLVNAIPENLPPVLADEDRLQQILQNLIGNAIKFTEAGSVTVHAAAKENVIRIAVEDTGIGIPKDQHDQVFQAFQQLDGTLERKYAGTGLGLSITKQLIELQSGRIWVESESGSGSTFFFELPVADSDPEVQPEQLRASPLLFSAEGTGPVKINGTAEISALPFAGDGSAKVHILIVDDEPINQQVLVNHLDDDHYLITTALSGPEALELIESGRHFDIILLDVMMPKMSGFEVCERIRQRYLPSELPIIMVTAKNLVQDLVAGLDTGANDYLAKPFSRDEFLARLKTQLRLHTINQASSRFVPNAFIHSLGKENITEVNLGDHVQRKVTVLFSDIRSYTTLAETMSPADNFSFVNAYNRRLGPIINQHRGFINQYMGDSIMALFLENPSDALHAAIAIQRELGVYNGKRREKRRQPIQAGIGFHTGNLIMGIIGDEKRMDATTISDTVNTASRLESLTKHYGARILFSRDSLELFNGQVESHFRYLGKVQMKGKKIPVEVYECFAADPPEVFEQKIRTGAQFAEAIDAYFSKDFASACRMFEEIQFHNPEDRTNLFFLQNAQKHFQFGVPEDWTGIEKMAFK